jgi:hypothetical protein
MGDPSRPVTRDRAGGSPPPPPSALKMAKEALLAKFREEKAVYKTPPETFKEVMGQKYWWSAFSDWARRPTNYPEAIGFVEAATRYKGDPTWARLDAIVDLYIREGAASSVNIRSEMLENIRRVGATLPLARTPKPAADVLNEALAEVIILLSDNYKDFIEQW